MNRINGWEVELQRFLTERREIPFAWATNDCATFAADWVRRCTGQSIFEPDYTDAMGAGRRMGGQEQFASEITAVLGRPLDNPRTASRGDIGLVGLEGRSCLGVVEGMYVAAPGERGMVLISRRALLAVWGI